MRWQITEARGTIYEGILGTAGGAPDEAAFGLQRGRGLLNKNSADKELTWIAQCAPRAGRCGHRLLHVAYF